MTNTNNNTVTMTEADKVAFGTMIAAMSNMSVEGKQVVNNTFSNMNTDNVSIPMVDFKAMSEELANLRNTPVQSERVLQLEQELAKLKLSIDTDKQLGWNTPKFDTNNYAKKDAEYIGLTGISFAARVEGAVGTGVARLRDFADMVGTYGQDKIAKELVPNTITNTTGFLSDLIAVTSEVVTGLGSVLATTVEGITNVASQTLAVGGHTVSRVGEVSSVAASNAVYNTFAILRK